MSHGIFRPDSREALPARSSRLSAASTRSSQQADAPEQRTRPIDVETIEALEELLISADVGVAGDRADRHGGARRGARSGESLRDLVKQEIRDIFDAVDAAARPTGTSRR